MSPEYITFFATNILKLISNTHFSECLLNTESGRSGVNHYRQLSTQSGHSYQILKRQLFSVSGYSARDIELELSAESGLLISLQKCMVSFVRVNEILFKHYIVY